MQYSTLPVEVAVAAAVVAVAAAVVAAAVEQDNLHLQL
jgi:hypothetical protein